MTPRSRIARGMLCLAAAAAWLALGAGLSPACAGDAPPAAQGFSSLDDRTLAGRCADGYRLLLAGDETAAEPAFAGAVQEDSKDAVALFGLAMVLQLRGEAQESLERYGQALAAGAARRNPWAELYLHVAAGSAPHARDNQCFLKTLDALVADASIAPRLRALAREARLLTFLRTGEWDRARAEGAPLFYLTRWALAGPFDNRDRAGFDRAYEPEEEVDFAKKMDGRNRKVGWFTPEAEPLNGVVTLAPLFEPNTHVLAYAATLVQAPQAQWVALHLTCAGAAKVWINRREVARVAEYNDLGDDKVLTPVYLRAGWNLVLVKVACVEDTEWAFRVRLSQPDGGPLAGLKIAATPEALAAWRAETAPPAEAGPPPQDFDPGLRARLGRFVQEQPEQAWARFWYGALMRRARLGEKEDPPDVRECARAAAACPRCEVFCAPLSNWWPDVNRRRQAAEASLAAHPGLPGPYERLADLLHGAGLEVLAEGYARQGLEKFGPARSGACALILSRILASRKLAAEAWKLSVIYAEQRPNLPAAWENRLLRETGQEAYRAVLQQARGSCGGDAALRRHWADELSEMAREKDAAELLEDGLRGEPFQVSGYLETARAWRKAGDLRRARAVLERARAVAPEAPAVLTALGLEELQAGQPAAARAFWDEALRIKPNSPELKDWLAQLSTGGGVDRAFFAPYEIALKDLPSPRAADYPNDNSVTLLNQQVVCVYGGGTASRMYHLVAKLLRADGLRELRQHQIHYEPDRQQVDILRAAVITPDGRELSRATVRDETLSAAMGVQTRVYDEHHVRNVFFNDLEPGALMDLQYVVRDTAPGLYGDYFSDLFYLADDQPVKLCQYILDLPKDRVFQTRVFGADVPLERLPSRDPEREVLKWERRDTPGVLAEPLMPPLPDLLPFVQVTTMRSWEEVGRWYWNLAQDAVQSDDEMRRKVAELTRDAPTPTAKVRAIQDWLVRELRYLSISLGRNGYKPHRAADTFKALYGDCKDTAVLLTAMFKEAGIESRLVLVRTRDSGGIEPQALPAPNLFNHCIACVPNLEGRTHWIDGTADYNQLDEVPALDQGAQVLVLGPAGGEFVRIPVDPPEANRQEQTSQVAVARNGAAVLKQQSVFTGQFAPGLRGLAETPARFDQAVQQQAARRFAGCELVRLSHSSSRDPGPFRAEAEWKVPALAAPSGDRLALPSALDPLELSRRFVTTAQRKHDLELWYPWTNRQTLTYELDPGLRAAALPEEAKLSEDFARFTRQVSRDGQKVLIRDEFVLSRPRILQNEFAKFRDFCHKVDALLQQKVLIEAK